VDEGNYTDISDPIWKEDAFPHFFPEQNLYCTAGGKIKAECPQLESNEISP
jgi:hypothetical protein